jgi:hypothetical protein
LDQSKVDPGLKQMRCPGVTKRVNRCLFVYGAFFEGRVECRLERAFVNRVGRLLKRDVSFAFRGEQPDGVAMGCPELAKKFEGSQRKGDLTILAALALTDVEHHP